MKIWIGLTTFQGNHVAVNLDAIASITQNGSATKIELTGGSVIVTAESLSEVQQILSDVRNKYPGEIALL